MQTTDNSQALVLSSGGADGAYAVGVLKALLNGKCPANHFQPLDPQILVGSSIGAFNAAFLASRLEETDPASALADLEQSWLEDLAEDHWGQTGAYRLRGDPRMLFDLRCMVANPIQFLVTLLEDGLHLAQHSFQGMVDFLASKELLNERLIDLMNLSMFISPDPLLALIQKHIRFDNIRRSKRSLQILTTDWAEGELNIFSNQDMTDSLGPSIVMASGALPGFFPAVPIPNTVGHQSPHVDAAVLGYTRLGPAIDVGANILHVIYLEPDIRNIPIESVQSLLDSLYRVFAITWANGINRSLRDISRINAEIDRLEDIIQKTQMSEEKAHRLLQDILPLGRFREDAKPFKVTAHRYNPGYDSGPVGLLNLKRHRLEALIEQGYNDAVSHDCKANGCILVEDT